MPWFIKHGPVVHNVRSVEVDIEDHLGKATVFVNEWGNGEGFDAILQREKEPEQRVEITWSEWTALKKAVRKIDEAKPGEGT